MELERSKLMDGVALSFTKHLFSREDYQEKNLIFSPLSLHVALSIMAAGSQGRTLDQLLSFLRFDSADHLTTFFSHLLSDVLPSDNDGASHHLAFANGMWADHSLSLSHSFKQLVASHYKATLDSVDFQNKGDQVRREVNSWVEKETNGLITELLPHMTGSKSTTSLLFANALHFKGVWEHQFETSSTVFGDFHLLNGTSVEVPFMKSKEQHERCIRAFDGFKVLRLAYEQGRDENRWFSMYIFLPDAKDGLSALIEKLASKSDSLQNKLPRRKVRVHDFKIPKFKFSFRLKASNVLKELGVVSPFSQEDANFTKMVETNSPSDKLYVESIFHKAFIDVNEKGTEAAAATVVHGQPMGWSHTPPGIDFVADHPFLFLIREDFTGTILFIGQVLNPLDGEDTAVKSNIDDEKSEVPHKRKRSNWRR